MGSSASKAAGSSARRFPSRAPNSAPKPAPPPPRQPAPRQPAQQPKQPPAASTSKTDGTPTLSLVSCTRTSRYTRIANVLCSRRDHIRLHPPRSQPRRLRRATLPDGHRQPDPNFLPFFESKSRDHAKCATGHRCAIRPAVEQPDRRVIGGEAPPAGEGRR